MHAIRLRTEHLQNPMGIDITTPMMHWNCAEGLRQNAFQLKCTDAHGALLWDSGKQTGAQMCVRYAGKPLCSWTHVRWQVRLWDENDMPGAWSEEAFFEDLYACQKLIYDRTGVLTTLLRFPGGSSNTVSKFNPGIMSRLTVAVQNAGFQYFDWNVDSNDAGGAKTAQEVFENVVNGCASRRVSIVLQHDIKGFSVEAVEKILIWGTENGYRFLALDSSSPGAHHGVNN